MISQQFRNMLRDVAELTTTQIEELQETMERMRTQDTHYLAIGMGHGRRPLIFNEVEAGPRAGQHRGIGIPGHTLLWSPISYKPTA
ncbi:hypothetical protein UB46_22740 [Burkholderiaceae bacterium 16]|nr:hypothetical protein UB46_22740 [Burkholderiaceae bacterium 16]